MDILNFIADIPWWGWLVLFIAYVIVFGKKKLWDYEVKFPFKEGIGRGKVEFECFEKEGPKVEVKLSLDPQLHNKKIDIYLSGHCVFSVPSALNIEPQLRIEESLSMNEPKEGEIVDVKIDDNIIFSGPLVLD